MWIILLLFGSVVSKDLLITKLDKSGVLMEKIPDVAFIENHLNIATYVNLTELLEEMDLLDNMVNTTGIICGKLLKVKVSSHCEYELFSLKQDWSSISDIKHLINEKKIKRSAPLVGIIGKIAKTVIGTLDDEDGQFFNDQISKIKDNEILLAKRLEKQTIILDSLFQIVNKTIVPSNEVYQQFQKKFEDFDKMLLKFRIELKSEINHLNLDLNYRECLSMTKSVKDSLKNKINLLINLLTSEKDHLNPFLFPANILISKLKDSYNMIPKNSKLPLQVSWSSIFEYYRIATESKYRYKNFLIFETHIPLVNVEQYQVYKITAVPVKIKDNKYFMYKFENDLLITDNELKKFAAFDSEYLEHCQHITNLTLCPHLSVMRSGSSCELDILKQSNNINHCKKVVIQINNITFFKLFKPNSWVVLNPVSEVTHLVCEKTNKPIRLHDATIIELSIGCNLISENINLYSTKSLNTGITILYNWNLNFSKMNVDFSNDIDTFETIPQITSKIIPFKDSVKIAHLGKDIETLRKEKINLKKVDTQNNNNFIIQTSVIIILIIMFSYLVYDKCIKKGKTIIVPENINIIEVPTELHEQAVVPFRRKK